MEAQEEPGDRRDSQKSRPTNPPRPRGEGGSPAGGNAARQQPDARRKRGNDLRFVGFMDGLERVYCAGAGHPLPTAFPVATHQGAATIPRAVVARRGETLLLCTFMHCGPHVWPDGETVSEDEAQLT